MCRVLEVSSTGFYSWINKPKSKRTQDNEALLKDIQKVHKEFNRVYGSIKIKKVIDAMPMNERHCKLASINHKRIERLMKENGIQSKTKKKYKATTDSNHRLPVAENILNREFKASAPNEKLVSDITYVYTEEGWLYVAGIMDLFGGKIVGLSMSERIKKELVIDALEDAYRHGNKPQGTILHSDKGSQYCSLAYQAKLKKYGYICSMSRKGNCWDNAPMESFWGKMKQEWLNDYRFKTRAEAKSKVFEYIMIFYNRKRIHETYNYQTPEDYYSGKLELLRKQHNEIIYNHAISGECTR